MNLGILTVPALITLYGVLHKSGKLIINHKYEL